MYETLAERVAYILKQSKLTQAEFASRISISQQYLSQICNGRKIPSDRTISDICREFGCNEVWLRTGEGKPDQERSREEEIMRSAVQTVKGSNEFRKMLAYMWAQLDEEDWANLEKIYNKQLQKLKKSDRE